MVTRFFGIYKKPVQNPIFAKNSYMRFSILKFLAGIMLTYIFTSCQKETSLENGTPGPNNPASADSTYIDRVRHIELRRGGLDSSTHIEQYKYDANKRLVSIVTDSMYRSPGHSSPYDIFTKKEFFYIGNDTLPYKYVYTLDDSQYPSGGKDTSTSWLFYTGNRILKDYPPYHLSQF
jgi:hypothetical protein